MYVQCNQHSNLRDSINLQFVYRVQVKLVYSYDRLDTVNGSGEYFNYALDISKQEGSDTVFMVQADIEQLIDLDDEWKVVFLRPVTHLHQSINI